MSGDIHALSGAYAVDAVDDIERMQFERHLAQCATCRDEVGSLREAAAQMSEASTVAAPFDLRARVLADIATVRPLPPLVARADDVRRSTRRLPALVAAAAALVVIGGVGASAWHPWEQTATPSVSASEFDRVLAAPDHVSLTHHFDQSASATLTRSATEGLAVLSARNLPAPAAGKAYELWLYQGDSPVRAGLITTGGDGNYVLSGNAATADAAAITIESVHGVDEPRGTAFAQFPFKPA